jgi:lactoylglutathione lyase
MKFLHAMLRVSDLQATIDFFEILGLKELKRHDIEAGRYTLVFLAAPGDEGAQIELTHNWDDRGYDGGRAFGHLAYEVEDIYAMCRHLLEHGITIVRPPRDGWMAFVKSPDGISIELLQKGKWLEPAEPWISMPSVGTW